MSHAAQHFQELPLRPSVAVERARRAAQAWGRLSVRHRVELIRRFRAGIAGNADELMDTVPEARRRVAADTLAAELIPLADACRFLEREAAALLRPRRLGRKGRPGWLRGTKLELHREPLGVVLILGAANYPLLLPGVQLLQALVAGNAVLLKPGSGGTAAARSLRVLLLEAGLDRDLVQVLSEEPEAGRAAIQAGVDRVLLTGSASTGKQVLLDLAERLVPATLELSGCDAVFVRPEADLELVTAALGFGLTLNQGATCIGPRRVFVPRSRAAELERKLQRSLRSLPGINTEEALGRGVRQLVAGAVKRGARLVLPSEPETASFGAFVLADVSPDMEIARADLFAPVLLLMAVENMEEALEQNASCPYALGASVFGNVRESRELAQRVKAGVVLVNDTIVPTADPRLPFAGRGQSGYGVTRGAEGLLELTAVKAISISRPRWKRYLDPPRTGDRRLFEAWLRAVHAGSWPERVRGFCDLLVAALRHDKTPFVQDVNRP